MHDRIRPVSNGPISFKAIRDTNRRQSPAGVRPVDCLFVRHRPAGVSFGRIKLHPLMLCGQGAARERFVHERSLSDQSEGES